LFIAVYYVQIPTLLNDVIVNVGVDTVVVVVMALTKPGLIFKVNLKNEQRRHFAP